MTVLVTETRELEVLARTEAEALAYDDEDCIVVSDDVMNIHTEAVNAEAI